MKKILVLVVAAAGLIGCAVDATPVDESDATEQGASSANNSTYLKIRPDLRRCASPGCGGYWVSRVNRPSTQCVDGSFHSECYVAELDGAATGLTLDELRTATVLRGDIKAKVIGTVGTFGSLAVREAWKPATKDAAVGTFYRVLDLGIRCVRAPCFSFAADKLNYAASTTLSSFAGAHGAEVGAELGEHKVLATGTVQSVRGGGRALNVTQYWTPVVHGACAATSDCGGGEQCLSGTCTARPLCVQVTTPGNKLAAKNFAAGAWADANAWGESTAQGGPWGISLATCTDVAHNLACTEQYQPVCGVSFAWNGAKTYGNDCELRGATIAAAGDAGEATAVFQKGVCGTSEPRCATYYLTSEGTTQQAYYVRTAGSAFEAKAWIELVPTAVTPNVLPGKCSAFLTCTEQYKPVCGGVKGDLSTTFGNQCEFEAAVRADSATDGWSKGRMSPGACRP